MQVADAAIMFLLILAIGIVAMLLALGGGIVTSVVAAAAGAAVVCSAGEWRGNGRSHAARSFVPSCLRHPFVPAYLCPGLAIRNL
jgi:hypothetical protein